MGSVPPRESFPMIPWLRDPRRPDAPPRLAFFLNTETLDRLPDFSVAPRGDDETVYAAVRASGYEGVQGGDPAAAHRAGLKHAAAARVNAPGEIDALAERWSADGSVCGTVHLGWGIEDDGDADRLIGAVLDASARHGVPVYVETHRATLFQDLWRSVRLAERHPGLKFNGDFSHWYTGLELPNGGLDRKLDFAAPVMSRVGFVHARIGTPGQIQYHAGRDLGDAQERTYVQDFLNMWTRVFNAFRANAGPGAYLPFTPELLSPQFDYALAPPGPDGRRRELDDRWQQALLYLDLARHAFAGVTASAV